MAAEFNPYHVWLGIPPEEQPANHYRLLGLKLFESSADVIDNAADRQMAHLRTIQTGKHADLSQRLLNELAAARVSLLDPKKRAAYDQQLRPNWRRQQTLRFPPPHRLSRDPRLKPRPVVPAFSASRRGERRFPLSPRRERGQG